MYIFKKLILSFLLFSLSFHIYAAQTLSPKLQHFMQKHPVITLGVSDQWDPYVIVGKDGNITGFNHDILQLVNRYTGAHFIQKAGQWATIQEEARKGKIDGLASLKETKERKEWLNFSPTYIKIVKTIFTSTDNDIAEVDTLDFFKGKTIVIEKDNKLDEKLAKDLGMHIVYANTFKEMYTLVAQKKYPFAFGHSAMDYFLGKYGLPRLKTIYTFNKATELKFAVRKDLPEAIEILNYGLSQIPFEEYSKLERKWFLKNNTYIQPKLTDEEKEYLSKKEKLTLCLPHNYSPFSFEEQNRCQGISVDISQKIATRIDTEITFSQKNCDFSSILQHPNEQYSAGPYLEQYFVLVTKKVQPYIEDLNIITGKVGVLAGFGYKEILQKHYPDLKIEEVHDIREGLTKVDEGKLLGYIGLLGAVAYHLETYALKDLKVSAKLDIEMPLFFTTKEKILATILQKTIDQIPKEEIEAIYRKWVHIEIRQINRFPYLKEIFLGFFFTLLASLFWIHKLSIAKKALEKSQNEIARMNANLAVKIRNEIQKSKEKDLLLLHQNRLAQMGEMISMIAHQWRQPLNVLSLQISTLKIKALKNRANSDTIANFTNEMMELTQYLSRTIDDFRNFFKPEKQKTSTSVNEIVENALAITKNSLSHKKIQIYKELHADTPFPLYKNELIQVLINIIKNAEDSLMQSNLAKKYIYIQTYTQAQKAFIRIADNGGGIPEEIIEHIFHPYFSTKDEKNGTGLGLYMSKMIVEKHSGGKLYATNSDEGAVFTVELTIT